MGSLSPGQGITLSTTNLASPTIAIDGHLLNDPFANAQESASLFRTSPEYSSGWQSPIRQHRRTPSAPREVKETLDARSEYTSDDEGETHHRINQYIIKEEIGRGSYGAVSLATDQFGNKYAVKEFSKMRLRKRAQSHILRNGPRRPHRVPAGGSSMSTPSMSISISADHGELVASPPLPFHEGLAGHRTAEARDALFLIREEIAIMKKLNHPNLVQLIEVLDDPEEDSLYMVMEMCERGVVMKVGLDEVAEPYQEEICRYWFRDLILGIEYLHVQGIIHRDIKPDNLLLSKDEVLKVVDFGVSEMFKKPEDMRTAKSAGSPAFLPPELCVAHHGNVSGKAADIWSMGVTLYCLRYGQIPFRRFGVLEMYESIKSDTPHIPEDENAEFRDLMTRILEKDPSRRITMDELREHPWVTRNGTDSLLSREENCAGPVEPPNALELSRAITRKMNHLMCVMKSIQKFKTLLYRHRRTSSRLSTPTNLTPSWQPFGPEEDKSKSVDIEALLEQRRKFMRTRKDLPSPIRTDPSSTPPQGPFLGVGAGAAAHTTDPVAHVDGAPPAPSTAAGTAAPVAATTDEDDDTEMIVAESPTAVDFNVYDRAYEAEIERIRNKDATTMYLTRFVGNKSHFLGVDNLVTVGGGASAANTPRLGPVAGGGGGGGLDQDVGLEGLEGLDGGKQA